MDSGVGPQNLHIVGQSFGAHIAGLAGKLVPNLRRITGSLHFLIDKFKKKIIYFPIKIILYYEKTRRVGKTCVSKMLYI